MLSEDVFFYREGWEAEDTWTGCSPFPLSPQHPADPSVVSLVVLCIVIIYTTKTTTYFPWSINYFPHSLDPYRHNLASLPTTHIRFWQIQASIRFIRDVLLINLVLQSCDSCGVLSDAFILHIWRWRHHGFCCGHRQPFM